MKTTIYSTLCAAALLLTASCSDFLETSSPSVVDADFVFSNPTTARAAMEGAYEQWRSTCNSYTFGAGLFYAADIAGSDIERHPEAYNNQKMRHIPEGLYENGTQASSYDIDSYSSNANSGAYVQLYDCIGKANAIITAMEGAANYQDIIGTATEPSALSQLYGEAVAMRAVCYRELIKYYGDVPFVKQFGVAANGLTPRDSIYDYILADLKRVEPLMYPVGSIPGVAAANKNYFSQTFVDALIGRIALEAGGYQTRRADINYVDGSGKAVEFDKLGQPNSNAANAFYARRSDWQTLYATAKEYYGKLLSGHQGTAKFYTTDPRSLGKNGQVYDNPFQYFFQQMMDDDAVYADESIYEYPIQWNVSSDERTYSSGRPSGGGSKNAYPCKDYGQARINPAYYYGIFDPQDKRRDVTVTVTGSNGNGAEVILPFAMGSTIKGGGLALNKWDENRQAAPNHIQQRRSGVNGPYMRMSEVYLGYAEACAATGDETTARQYLSLIRTRAFGSEQKADVDGFISRCASLYPSSTWSSLYKAIIEERGFEYAGEGDRRFTLLRTGLFPEAIKRIKELTAAMIAGLETQGYYTFDNGNTISASIYTKAVDMKSDKGYRLTTQCSDEADPLLYPGWRGQNDDWTAFGLDYAGNTKTNLAIQGLFSRLTDDEVETLKADGYAEVEWGSTLVSLKDEYLTHLFTDYDYTSAPVYLWPICPNAVSTGGFTNGYGFSNE